MWWLRPRVVILWFVYRSQIGVTATTSATSCKYRYVSGRVPHCSRSLREVGFSPTPTNPQPALRRIFSSQKVQSLI
jgi:hypothetical protein